MRQFPRTNSRFLAEELPPVVPGENRSRDERLINISQRGDFMLVQLLELMRRRAKEVRGAQQLYIRKYTYFFCHVSETIALIRRREGVLHVEDGYEESTLVRAEAQRSCALS